MSLTEIVQTSYHDGVDLLKVTATSKTGKLCVLSLIGIGVSFFSHQLTLHQALGMAAVTCAVLFLRHAIDKVASGAGDTQAQAVASGLSALPTLSTVITDGADIVEQFIEGKIDKNEAERRALQVFVNLSVAAGAATSNSSAAGNSETEKATSVVAPTTTI